MANAKDKLEIYCYWQEKPAVSEGRKRSKDNRPANMHNKNVNQ